jgi:hypothetical protein
VLPNCPTPLLGRDILTKFQATLTSIHPHKSRDPSTPHLHPRSLLTIIGALLPQASPNSLPLPATLVDPIVWDLKNPSVASLMSQLSLLSKIFYFSKSISISHFSNPPTGSKAYYLRASP